MATTAETTPAASARQNVSAAYRRIRRMLLSGQLESGQPLSQVQLATKFQISRGPVREALRMLQREGLIEAETNQRGRVATFTIDEMEQVCAMLALNVAAAILVGDGRFTSKDNERIQRRIDLIEHLADTESNENPVRAKRRIFRRQLAFRRLLTDLCRYSGPQVVGLIDNLLDRIALFRQIRELSGDSPPYPLANRFPELRRASESCDGKAMAAIVVAKIAEVSRKALAYLSEQYRPLMLDAYVDLAGTSCVDGDSADGDALHGTTMKDLTIRISAAPDAQLRYAVMPE